MSQMRHNPFWVALQFPSHQSCPKCGAGLQLFSDGKLVAQGYSPFTAEKHTVVPPSVPSPEDKRKSMAE
jgi:hypothetical protein